MVEEIMVKLFAEKYENAVKALNTLEEALNTEYSSFVQDASIQRFEYTTEAVWKCLQSYLKEYEGILCASPKACMREAKKITLMDDEAVKLALEMIDDRNLTSHTYHEEVAEMIFKLLPLYSLLMKNILNKIKPGI
ncbi:MAG: HI0074 family nucleotidyltransferase substrate-binding subunit [Ignavibacteriae bacterium]|nr:HI0074 family nucleotidyltransferase substrate-binding subunit [Ignavibacteriota bacterium]